MSIFKKLSFASAFCGCLGLCLMMSACKTKVPSKLSSSGGKTCEILVVCDKPVFNSAPGDSLRAFFAQKQVGLNQMEPLFSLANISAESFSDTKMFQRLRNIIIIEIDPQASEKFEAKQNVWAAPQIIFKFVVPTKTRFCELFAQKRELMLKGFYDREYLRIQKTFKSSEVTSISDRIKNVFGFYFVFPDGFQIVNINKHFAWIKKESKEFGQGMLIHTFPYTKVEDLQLNSIIKKRNEITSLVPGPLDGSYMTTETQFTEVYPQAKEIRFADKYAIETRGLWKLKKDYMGGPFVNYVFVDEKNKQLVMIDTYLYSPRKPKRDLLLQMEAIARGIVFDTLPSK
ncbi:MAG: DUF4837 family protein [Bacteroidales bacterium]